jgi:UDP-N-acetylglucosamine 2-epimerase (non-hydrolysing)
MTPLRVLFVFGTRPEAIKLAPVIQDMAEQSCFQAVVCLTAQHRQMLDQVLSLFSLKADYDLDLMRPDQTLAGLTGVLVQALDSVVAEVKPDWLVVQGDTTSAMAGALVAFYRRTGVAHVEAGLRTHNLGHPFPEEFNRRVIDVVSRLYFAPTERAAANLRREGVRPDAVRVYGNTGVDALLRIAAKPFQWSDSPIASLEALNEVVLVTAHRRESFGHPFEEMCWAIRELANHYPANSFVYPVHLNPNVQDPARKILQGIPNVYLLPPLDYLCLVQLLKKARLVLTDSGGIQEEAPSFGLPVLVMRETTERPEAVEGGFARLVGTSRKTIVGEASALLSRPAAETRINRPNPFGDGRSSGRILEALKAGPLCQ